MLLEVIHTEVAGSLEPRFWCGFDGECLDQPEATLCVGGGHPETVPSQRPKGDFIAPIDADDLWMPTKIVKQMAGCCPADRDVVWSTRGKPRSTRKEG